MSAPNKKGGEPDDANDAHPALVGLGLAGALFLGAGAAVAQTADDSSSSSSTTTAQESQQNGTGARGDCPEGSGGQRGGDQSSEQ